jgi:hypothetical protein
MSYGGIGSILSSVGGAAITPALETYIQDYLSKSLTDKGGLLDSLDPEKGKMLSNIAGGTLGTLLGTGLNAGLGYLTGGKSGAASGALQGLIMGGGAALQHDKFKQSLGMDEQSEGATPAAGSEATNRAIMGQVLGTDLSTPKANAPAGVSETPDTTKPKTSAGREKHSYLEMTGKLAFPALGLGMGLGSSMDYTNKLKEEEDRRKYAEIKRQQDLNNMIASLYGSYAEGGELKVQSNGATVTFPEWFVEDYARAGGIGGYATGGYINTQQMDPDKAYPQSMIPKAQPYPAAAPIRHEVLNMERGGLLEGDGDGMSDHIPANIDGKEEVRVADGEYVVPADIAKRFGEDRLHAMMNKVRSAAHAKKGKQVVEDAGKRAFIQTMSKVKA